MITKPKKKEKKKKRMPGIAASACMRKNEKVTERDSSAEDANGRPGTLCKGLRDAKKKETNKQQHIVIEDDLPYAKDKRE